MFRHPHLLFILAAALLLTACGSTQDLTPTYTPEESALGLVKVTDESTNSVIGPSFYSRALSTSYSQSSSVASSWEGKAHWYPGHYLTVSPDGQKIAYVSRLDGQNNIVLRGAFGQSSTTQRTFRNVGGFSWGADGNIYFADVNAINAYSSNSYISVINAEQGALVTQLTNGSVYDEDPVTLDGKTIFFSRNSKKGPSIWSINRENGTLTSCARGYSPCLIPGNDNAFYCVRNSASGRSEIWYVDFMSGQETLILSDAKRSFANPVLSPDGRWILCEGNTVSTDNKKKKNLDIFAVRTDGTQLTQLTYNSSIDACPAFSPDGRYVYFLSTRANDKEYYNVWMMHFNL